VIEAIVSDWGGVLTSPLFGAFARFQERAGIPLETLGVAMQRIAERDGENPLFGLERGELTEADFLADLGAVLSTELGRPVAMEGFADHYFDGLDANEPMLDWLRSARDGSGLRLALLTNNVREWEPRWRAMFAVDELFEMVVDSAFVGVRKPDPKIYEIVLERLGLPAGSCAFVDDLEHNCVAAAELGMHAVWFRDTDQAVAELEALLDGSASAI
jgi:haloacid dehalogenase superfamily, subfamily IA, variant 3 with third motif having DD or ED